MPRTWITTSFTPAEHSPVSTTGRFVGWLVQHRYSPDRRVPIDSRVIPGVLDDSTNEVVPEGSEPHS